MSFAHRIFFVSLHEIKPIICRAVIRTVIKPTRGKCLVIRTVSKPTRGNCQETVHSTEPIRGNGSEPRQEVVVW